MGETKTAAELLSEKYVVKREEKCPVCLNVFSLSDVRKTKIRIVGSDPDLRTYYEPVDPLYYDIIVCDSCGYAADGQFFKKIKSVQKDLIKNKITPNFKPEITPDIHTAQTAINGIKLAHACACAKSAGSGEIGYLFLKAAWIFRDLKVKEREIVFLNAAANEFQKAFTTESFPICTMDSSTLQYLIGALLFQCEDYGPALKWISPVVASRDVSSRLKNRAINLKDEIRKYSSESAV